MSSTSTPLPVSQPSTFFFPSPTCHRSVSNIIFVPKLDFIGDCTAKIQKGGCLFSRLETPGRIQSYTESQLERKKTKKKNRKAEHSGLAWCRTLGIQQRKAHKLLDWRQEPSVLSHPPGWRPLPSHTRPLSTSSPLYSARYRWEPHLSALAYFQHFSSSRSLSFSSPPPPPLHPFLVLSQDALMSAHTCCHIPPVPSSARHDRIGLNWAAAGGAAKQLDKPGLIERAGRKRRRGWAGTPLWTLWTGDVHVPTVLCSPILADTVTNGLIFPGSSSAPLRGLIQILMSFGDYLEFY